MKIITGFEPSRIITRNPNDSVKDVLMTTEHVNRYKEDLKLVKDLGITTVRVAVPWHRIEMVEGYYDWKWMDDYMAIVKELGLDPIMDLLHHTSFPTWLDQGFLSPKFTDKFIKFCRAVITRYPEAEKWTIINEPMVTALFCTNGTWFPFIDDSNLFETVIDRMGYCIHTIARELNLLGKKHIYVDACEVHRGTCESSNRHADFKNNWRFTLLDKLEEWDTPIHILGLDYYAHCEFEWCQDGRKETEDPVGFAAIAETYYERYKIPIMLSETNIRGFITDRQSWFVHMYKQCQILESKIPFEGMCWYPFIDSTDWDTLITKANGNIDPVGIIWLDKDMNRHESEFSDSIKNLTRSIKSIEEFNVRSYEEPLYNHLKGFTKLEYSSFG